MSRRAPHLAVLAWSAPLAIALSPGAAAADPFSYRPAGELLPSSGQGRRDDAVYAPGLRFPIEEGPAFANSQVYNKGGSAGPPGGQCDASNYAYPWRDNYCEARSWDMPLCPAGAGHQGQDLRPPTCEAGKHWVVAVVGGTITAIGSYSVYLTGDDGTRYEYLHMSNVQVAVGEQVARGQRVGKVANVFGGTPTTIHLHFNLRQFVSGVGTVFVPPYTSLVSAYQTMINAPPKGALDAVDCKGIRGWTQDPDAPDEPARARLYFDAASGEDGAVGYSFAAEAPRDDLCSALGSCDHAFEAPVPLSLLGGDHRVRAYGADIESGAEVELDGSPKQLSCPLVLPAGVRRPVRDPASMDRWGFARFWDVANATDAALEALPLGDDLPASPALVRSDAAPPEAPVWLLDGVYRRAVPTAEIATAWSLDTAEAEVWPAAKIDALPLGPELPARPFLAHGAAPLVYLIDTPPDEGGAGGAGGRGQGSAYHAEGTETGFEGHVRCDCGVAGAGGGGAGWPLGFAAAALAAARRRRRAA